MLNNLLNVWSSNQATSLVVWGAILMVVLYLGRKQAHQVFYSTGRALYRAMRMWAYTLSCLESRLSIRNKEILLANGAKEAEKAIEREFSRVHDIVQRDLSQYPILHRQIGDVIDAIELDYQQSTDVAPLPPAWKDVVETITSIPQSGDPAVNKILQNVKNAVDESHSKTLKAYKKSSAERHRLLGNMQPDWRRMQGTMDEVNKKVHSIEERSKEIDSQMQSYQEIKAGEDAAASSLSSSATTQLFISGLVLVIAILGGLVNFQLIAMPMSEMVGGTSYIGVMKTSDIAALVIILVEIAMGLFLIESLRITHLFPIIGSMDDKLRKRMIIVTFTILTILATIEASLAYMRDLLALDREALNQALSGAGVTAGAVQAQFRWIPSVGQMVMGFILPFALAFVAIPLESFIHSLRVSLGLLAIGLLRSLRVIVRILGGLLNHFFMIARHLYDLIIVIPLGVERLVKSYMGREIEVDVPVLTRVEAEGMSNKLKSKETLAKEASAKSLKSKATITSSQVKAKKSKAKKRVIDDSSLADIDLSETMMRT